MCYARAGVIWNERNTPMVGRGELTEDAWRPPTGHRLQCVTLGLRGPKPVSAGELPIVKSSGP